MNADLHCHSTCSDGSLTPRELVFTAKRLGLSAVAITDHDSIDGWDEALEAGCRYGIRVLPGCELSALDPNNGRRVHLLCYGAKQPQALLPLLERVSRSRSEAGLLMADALMERYPDLTMERIRRYARGKSIYKVHLMQALVDLGYDNRIYGDLYSKLFRSSSPESVAQPVAYPSVEEALQAIAAAGGMAVLAHPSVYGSMELLEQLAVQGKLDGVELWHPRNRAEDQKRIAELAEERGLFLSGGSDFHGAYSSRGNNPLAAAVLPEAQWQHFWANLREKADLS